jgi:CheY-like chemotaxis protein
MLIRFWGTRGSLAKPGPTTLRYGGNTACVEVRTQDGTLIVLDCGTGAHGLGLALAADGHPVRGHLMITHTHWDHIQGFPFFAPLFSAANEWDIYAPGGLGRELERTLAGQMEYTYFPVRLDQLGATIRYHDLVEGAFEAGGLRVVTKYLNHPALALGYRIEAGAVSIVYSADHEPHATQLVHDAQTDRSREGAPLVHQEDRRHVEFLSNADLVVHDAQYALEEYPHKIGWGHTPAEYAVDYAVAAGARRLALYHHDPLRDDDAVDRLVEVCRRRAADRGGAVEIFAAAEGLELDLAESDDAGIGPERSVVRAGLDGRRQTVLIVDDDPTIVKLLIRSLEPDGFRVLTAGDGHTALRLARTERPALLLLDWHMPGLTGLDVTRSLRADADAELQAMPVVLITGQTGAQNTAEGFAAGVTDYLTKPFRPAHVRARVSAWLLRRSTGAAPST